MKGILYQLLDVDGFQRGLLYTEDERLMDHDLIERLWEKWYMGEDYSGDTDDFVAELEELGYTVERVYSVDVNP